LQFYILQLISEGRIRSHDILRSIERKGGAGWTSGLVLSTLRKFVVEGLVLQTPSRSRRSPERVYEITSRGAAFLKEGKDVLSIADRNWFEMRGIFIDLMEATSLPEFLSEGSKANFQLSREIIQAKMPKLDQKEVESALRDYALNLRKQVAWTEARILKLSKDSKPQPQDARTGLTGLGQLADRITIKENQRKG
jgi:DNA-binding PadR family transcriptional regulator